MRKLVPSLLTAAAAALVLAGLVGAGSTSNPQGPASPEYQCSDTYDNDGDGLIDMGFGTPPDPGCSSAYDNDEYNAAAATATAAATAATTSACLVAASDAAQQSG